MLLLRKINQRFAIEAIANPFALRRGANTEIKTIARYAVARRCGRLEWSVLDWNQPAIDFYLSIGAAAQSEWVRYRLDGEALVNFAEQ